MLYQTFEKTWNLGTKTVTERKDKKKLITRKLITMKNEMRKKLKNQTNRKIEI